MAQSSEPDYARGALAGIAGGLIASYAMNQFQAALAKTAPQAQPAGQQAASPEPLAVKVANAVSHKILDRDLSSSEKDVAGEAVHYAFGAAAGAIYGVVAEAAKAPRFGFGALFGSVLWFLGDEVAAPQLGLSKPASAYPASVHASAWASHLVYGITTDLVRRGLRAI